MTAGNENLVLALVDLGLNISKGSTSYYYALSEASFWSLDFLNISHSFVRELYLLIWTSRGHSCCISVSSLAGLMFHSRLLYSELYLCIFQFGLSILCKTEPSFVSQSRGKLILGRPSYFEPQFLVTTWCLGAGELGRELSFFISLLDCWQKFVFEFVKTCSISGALVIWQCFYFSHIFYEVAMPGIMI